VIALPPVPSFRLEGKRALVTGAGRGLGLAAATALAHFGAHVALAARSRDEVEEAAAALSAAGFSAEALPLDVTDTAAVRQAFAARPAFDVLVNNAGTNRPGPFVRVTAEEYDTVFALNVRSAFFVAQAVVERLLAEGRPGSIINMSSQMGHVGAENRTIYCASKHAIEGLTKAMAVELGEAGIRVNSVCPTFIETSLTQPYFADEAFRSSVLKKIKLGRIGTVEDVASAIVYLASDAAALVTGTALKVDGGWTAE
jgi:NAD(P)-dependent dehydrogenase (short-subunit alcohol dehydrogenase family)